MTSLVALVGLCLGAAVGPPWSPVAPSLGPPAVAPAHVAIGAGAGLQVVQWIEDRGDDSDVVLARVSATSGLLDPGGVRIATAPAARIADTSLLFDGTNFLALWQVEEHARWHFATFRAARVTPGGQVLDALPWTAQVPSVDQQNVTAAFNGQTVLLAWMSWPDTSADVYVRRVEVDGAPVDSTELRLTTRGGQLRPRVAASGSLWWVVWEDTSAGASQIVGLRVGADGQPLDANALTIATAPRKRADVDLTCDDARCWVGWTDERSGMALPYLARLTAAGAVLDPGGIAAGATALTDRVRLASAGGSVVACWGEHRGAATAVEATFASDQLPGLLAVQPLGATPGSEPVAGASPEGSFAAWMEGDLGVRGTRLSATGVPIDTPALVLSRRDAGELEPGPQRAGTLGASATGRLWLGFSEHTPQGPQGRLAGLFPSGQPDETRRGDAGTALRLGVLPAQDAGVLVLSDLGGQVTLQRFDDQGQATSSPQVLTSSASVRFAPAAAVGPRSAMAVWINTSEGADHLEGCSISLDGIAGPLHTVQSSNWNLARPSLAHDGVQFLAAWEGFVSDRRAIKVSRLSDQGVPLDGEGLDVSPDGGVQSSPNVVAGGAGSLVVWSDDGRPRARLVGTDGGFTSPVLVLDDTPSQTSHLRAAWDGQRFLAVWERNEPINADLWAAEVSTDGLVSSPFVIAGEPYDERGPSVISNGLGLFLVAYEAALPQRHLGLILLRQVDLRPPGTPPEAPALTPARPALMLRAGCDCGEGGNAAARSGDLVVLIALALRRRRTRSARAAGCSS